MSRKKIIYDVIIVGAGAAGLMAAITVADQGCLTLVLEHNEEAGKKILSTGNGRCNFTNKKQGRDCYRCSDPAFVVPALSFTAEDTIRFFEQELHIRTKEMNGYCYPRSGQASVVRESLARTAFRKGVLLKTGIGIRSVKKEDEVFVFDTKQGVFYSRTCILACGGKAAPASGSDGSGYVYARQLGHQIIEPLPALVPLIADVSKTPWLKKTAGVRCHACVTLFIDGEKTASDTGEVQMTDYGVSGIPVFQISRYASRALSQGKHVEVAIDFLPEFSYKEVLDDLTTAYRELSHSQIEQDFCQMSGIASVSIGQEILCGLLNQKISAVFTASLNLKKESQIRTLVSRLKNTRLTIIGTKAFQQAQVTCGGVDIRQIHAQTMESDLVTGLYFAGEIIDVDGICGGYNLQWAWSSAVLAASSAAKNRRDHE